MLVAKLRLARPEVNTIVRAPFGASGDGGIRLTQEGRTNTMRMRRGNAEG
jgi:hypothetical protein